jgi:uridine phosphorylase
MSDDKNVTIDCPISEFFNDEGVISPHHITEKTSSLPSHIDTAVILFERRLDLDIFKKCVPFYEFKGGSFVIPQFIYDNKIVIGLAPLGSAAAAGLMEELIPLGVKRFIACGSAGAIDHNIDTSSFIIVEKAIRDEGTSYHYLPPSLTVSLDEELNKHIECQLKGMNLTYIKGTTWTTDGFYRETPSRINKRHSEGAICVEMECAAFAAVAKYRKVQFAQILYFSDIVHQQAWSGFMTSSKDVKAKLNEITISIALSLINRT